MPDPVFLSALGIVSPIGHGKQQVFDTLMAAQHPGVVRRRDLLVGDEPIHVGAVSGALPTIPEALSMYASRNTAMMIATADEIRDDIERAISSHGRERIAVVMGTSTSGMDVVEQAVGVAATSGKLPADYDFRQHELGSPAEALARYLDLGGAGIYRLHSLQFERTGAGRWPPIAPHGHRRCGFGRRRRQFVPPDGKRISCTFSFVEGPLQPLQPQSRRHDDRRGSRTIFDAAGTIRNRASRRRRLLGCA